MRLSRLLLPLAAILLPAGALVANPKAPPPVNIALKVENLQGQPVKILTAGEYIRVDVSADFSSLPNKASASVTASAAFTTKILGRTVGYSLSLPMKGSAGSRTNPLIGVPLPGSDLVESFEETAYREVLDFQVPPEAPEGLVTFSVTVAATGIKPIKRRFAFPVRPMP
jgi:hypothetical protein